jgi:predicted exporter
MTRPGAAGALVSTLAWVVLVCIAAVVVSRASYTTDLSAFLPRTPTATQRMLVEQLREGFASRLLMVAVEGADSKTRADVSRRMAQQLRATNDFVTINNGDSATLERDRTFLFQHRYLLSETVTPERFTVAGLRSAISDTLDLLASPAGLLVKSILPSDPTGEMVQIIDQLGSGGAPRTQDGVWSSRDGQRALLVMQTRASGSDTDGQQHAVEAIQHAFNDAVAQVGSAPHNAPEHNTQRAGLTLKMSGPGVYSVEARDTIKSEVMRLSGLSAALIVALLLAVYRSVPALVLGLVPVASGALAGVAAVALGFGLVHGITLGFGATLIGEAVDYSIYLFVQSRNASPGGPGGPAPNAAGAGRDWKSAVWPTIRLGMLTSVFGFASLLPSGFPGLAQLGLYSIAGLVAAAAVTRFVLPHWLPRGFAIRDVTPLGVAVERVIQRLAGVRVLLLLLAVAAVIVLITHSSTLWNRDLSALSPVSQANQDLDAALRADIGAPDVSYLVVVSASDPQAALQAAEQVQRPLDRLTDAGVIGGFESPARYLPSLATQRQRQNSLPGVEELRDRLREAVAGLPVSVDRLEPFIRDVEAARTQPLLTRSDLDETSLAAGFDALMLHEGGRWRALLPLKAVGTKAIDLARVRQGVAEAHVPDVFVLDLKGEADALYSTYLTEAVRLSLAGFVCIVILLLVALRSPARVVRVVAPLGLAVLTVATGLVLLGRQLTILHVIGMLLIVAVGSNYALFFDRRSRRQPACAGEPSGEPEPGHTSSSLTLASLVIANATAVVSFGVLAFSTVPVLAALGSTVAPGALLALIFSALLAR